MVGVPEVEYESLKAAALPLFDEYRRLTRPELLEFKHSEFKRIGFARRKELAVRLADAMKAKGVFVGGFYTPVTSFVLGRVNTNGAPRRSERS